MTDATNPTTDHAATLAAAERTEQDAAQALADAQDKTRAAYAAISTAATAAKAKAAGQTNKAIAAAGAAAKIKPAAAHLAAKAAEGKAKLALDAAKTSTRTARRAADAAEAKKAKDEKAAAAEKAKDDAAAERNARALAKTKAAEDRALAEAEAEADRLDFPTASAAFAAAVSDRLVWNLDAGHWLIWDGRRWAPDSAGGVASAAVAMQWIATEAQVSGSAELRGRANAAAELLRWAAPRLGVPGSSFDAPATAHLLTVANGTIDLRTGKLLDHDPTHGITRLADVAYVRRQGPALWDKAVAEIFCGDAGLAGFVQHELGMAATGFTAAKRLYLALGDQEADAKNGNNGKTLFFETVKRALGDYASTVSASLFCQAHFRKDASSHDAAMAPLIGKRLAVGEEFQAGATLDIERVKTIAGGTTLTARMPNAPLPVLFEPATVWISSNRLPEIGERDAATVERLIPIPFVQVFHHPDACPPGGLAIDFDMGAKLSEPGEREAVLAWIVAGAVEFYRTGRPAALPDAVRALRSRIFADQDPFADILAEVLDLRAGGIVLRADLREIVEKRLGAKLGNAGSKRLAEAVKAFGGVANARKDAGKGWTGVSLSWRGGEALAKAASKEVRDRAMSATEGETLREHAASIRADMDDAFEPDQDDLTDPQGEPDPEEIAARDAAFEAQAAAYGQWGRA